MKGLFIFRRDLRLYDNTGLIQACKECDVVYAVFILDPAQITPKKNKYFTYTGFHFMLQSLADLKREMPAITFKHGTPAAVIKQLISEYKIDQVYINEDYTPYSVERDKAIENAIAPIKLVRCSDYCLNTAHDIKPYKVYSAYYKVASKQRVRKPVKFTGQVKSAGKSVILAPLIKFAVTGCKKQHTDMALVQQGGRDAGLACLRSFQKRITSYKTTRNLLTSETSRLSPHLKFGTLSIREVYYECDVAYFRRELYWRDFFMQVSYHFPEVFKHNYRYKIRWSNNKEHLLAWQRGETGYNIVDAAMVQLNTTGFMHNRARMIVASFLTKILHIDWRLGEHYFATRLTDYDPSSNNGNWGWVAGVGVDAQPYYRIFNPYIQQKKFDPKGEYIKHWLGDRKPIEPIVDYEKERKRALTLIQK